VHAWGVFGRVDRVEDFLVELSSKIARKTMNFGSILLDSERKCSKLLHTLLLTLRQVGESCIVGVGQMSESEHIS